jgi:hypothetical protein
MTEGESQAVQSTSKAGAKRPDLKCVFMIHLDIERMRIKKALAKNDRKKTPRVQRLRRFSGRHYASVSAQMLRAQAWA